MAFIDTYIAKYRTIITPNQEQNLRKLEKKLDSTIQNSHGTNFNSFLQKYGEQINDLLGRAHKYFETWKFSWKNLLSAFSFVSSISLEVYQIVRDLEVFNSSESWEKKEEFAKELIYFIWKAIGPLDKFLSWVPFRQIIEKKLVIWLATMGLEAAHKLFSAKNNKEVAVLSANNYAKAF